MDEAVEQVQFLPIGKDDVAELTAVDGPVRLEDPLSEMADDLLPHRPVRFLNGMTERIEVDETGAFFHQSPGDG